MLSSSAQFTAVAAPHDPRLHPVGSAWPAMPVRQADADDADDATHHGNRGGVSSWCTKQPEPVTILKPMCRINMTPEGDPQVALAASHPVSSVCRSTCCVGARGRNRKQESSTSASAALTTHTDVAYETTPTYTRKSGSKSWVPAPGLQLQLGHTVPRPPNLGCHSTCKLCRACEHTAYGILGFAAGRRQRRSASASALWRRARRPRRRQRRRLRWCLAVAVVSGGRGGGGGGGGTLLMFD